MKKKLKGGIRSPENMNMPLNLDLMQARRDIQDEIDNINLEYYETVENIRDTMRRMRTIIDQSQQLRASIIYHEIGSTMHNKIKKRVQKLLKKYKDLKQLETKLSRNLQDISKTSRTLSLIHDQLEGF